MIKLSNGATQRDTWKGRNHMKNLQAGGFLFLGGAIIMTTTQFGKVVPMIGAACALLGVGMLIYYLFSNDGEY